jgi:electron transport complex protein RnfE
MLKQFTGGLIRENPVFVLLMGLCPALAVSTRFINGLGMGAAVLFVLLGSNISISLLRNFLPEKLRILSSIIIIAGFSTVINLLMRAFTPELAEQLGIFLPLVAVNCIILGRAESVARKNGVVASLLDALGMGLGFLLALCFIALIRETLGTGTLTLLPAPVLEDGVIEIPGIKDAPVALLVAPAGALIVIGVLKGLFNAFGAIKKRIISDAQGVMNIIKGHEKNEKRKDNVE